ncbi:MAG: RNA 2',3'-cyclic phosphodiesterase [Desulfatiglandaceae bacterium]|jgi:RNA 2',3'-cyclic 3'-phosphodiesterase
MAIRSFLAFELPRQMKDIVSGISAGMRAVLPEARWVRVDHIHLTVVFLGQIPESSLEGIADVAKSVCDRYDSFEIALKGAGVFSGLRNPRVLWVGLQGELERMGYCRNALQKRLTPFGIKKENRKFRPHLTLCRFRKGAKSGPQLVKILDGYREISSPFFRLNALSLFKSDLTSRGSIYTRLTAWPLAGKKQE